MSRDEDNRAHREGHEKRVRVDQWLWAARFYKTRALAADAVDGGRIEVNGDRVKRSRILKVGDEVRVRMPPYEHILEVESLSARRGPATEARRLYRETDASREARERMAWQVRNASIAADYERGRPGKKDRRELERLKRRKDW
jgi:ribosome-associated heat shock protein Hsp15